jgi:hypothetical protein
VGFVDHCFAFVPFLGAIVLSGLSRLSASEYQFDIFSLFFLTATATRINQTRDVASQNSGLQV